MFSVGDQVVYMNEECEVSAVCLQSRRLSVKYSHIGGEKHHISFDHSILQLRV